MRTTRVAFYPFESTFTNQLCYLIFYNDFFIRKAIQIKELKLCSIRGKLEVACQLSVLFPLMKETEMLQCL